MKIRDEKILKKLIDIRDNGKSKQERIRAGAIILSKTAFALTVEEIGIKMSYNTFKLFLKKHSSTATKE